jgi:hypothetical protein
MLETERLVADRRTHDDALPLPVHHPDLADPARLVMGWILDLGMSSD